MNPYEFRQAHPFRPHQICRHRDGQYLEIISYPYQEEYDSAVFVKARVPEDPTTIETYRVSEPDPDLILLIAKCERDNTTFNPMLSIRFKSSITCEKCGRGYYLNPDNNQWESDRSLTFLTLQGKS